MQVEWNVPIRMDDGLSLRADVFRPDGDGPYPVLLSHGPYAKGLTFQQGYGDAWKRLLEVHPEVARTTSNQYQAWEVADPERWVPEGYVCVRVDARGWGMSPGFVEPYGPQETRDFGTCIEWAGTRPWSNGRVGLLGISYYAVNQWLVAGTQPDHLAAILPWEGYGDPYRDSFYHGGILCTSVDVWYGRVIDSVQHGIGARGASSPHTGEWVTGAATLTDEQRAARRSNYTGTVRGHQLADDFYRQRSADWDRITVPFLAAGNWGGAAKHLRGATEGFQRARSTQKWLEIHGGEHWTGFYSDEAVTMQLCFFDHFLKGEDNGWPDRPPVRLQVRHVDGSFVGRDELEWPLDRTAWTRLYPRSVDRGLWREPPPAGTVSFAAMGDGVTFSTPPLAEEVEITGPVSATVFVSSSTTDADLFLVLRVFDPDGREVVFQGAIDPHTPVAQGWLRASHRKLDPELSSAYRPYHTHDEVQPLEPGRVYELQVEIWPTSVVVPRGYRVALTIRGCDHRYEGDPTHLDHFGDTEMRGVGIYRHDDPDDRPPGIFDGTTTLHMGPDHPTHLLVPVIPPAAGSDGGG